MQYWLIEREGGGSGPSPSNGTGGLFEIEKKMTTKLK